MTKKANVVAMPSSFPQVTKTVRTRLNKGKDPVTSNAIIIFDSPEIEREMAMRAAVIALQALWRDAGVIPATETVSLSELKKRGMEQRHTRPATAEAANAALDRLPDAEYAKILSGLGIPATDIKKRLAARAKQQ